MNKFINIKKILEDKGVSKTEVATLVFPDVKFPQRAFSRVLTGKTELTVSQAATIAEFLGVRIEDLYEPDRWIWDNSKDGKHIFLYGNNFRAEVDTQTWNTRLYHKDELITEEVICDGQTPIGEYFAKLKRLVLDWIDLS